MSGIPIGGYGGGLPQNGSVQSITATDHLGLKIATPAIGGDGEARLYARSVGGNERLAQIGGDAGAVSRLISSSEMCCFMCTIYPNTSTTLQAFGSTVATAGTVSHPNQTATSLLTESRRWQIATAAAIDTPAEVRSSPDIAYRGASAGRGGFTWASRFGVVTYQSGMCMFNGLYVGTGALAGTARSSSLLNMVGIGFDVGDSNLSVMHNDGSGTATKVDLGANFPANAGLYTASLHCEPGTSTIGYTVVRNDTLVAASGYLSTNLPDSSTFLTQHNWASTGTSAASISVAGMFMYLEVPMPSV